MIIDKEFATHRVTHAQLSPRPMAHKQLLLRPALQELRRSYSGADRSVPNPDPRSRRRLKLGIHLPQEETSHRSRNIQQTDEVKVSYAKIPLSDHRTFWIVTRRK